MSSTVTFNGTSYTIPATGDENWSDNLSLYLIAIASGSLQKTGGTFTLTTEADFGATYGLKSNYFKSRATNPSSTGILRLGNNEGIGFRNAANNADLVLKANASDVLEYNGSSIVSTGSLTDLITNTMVNSSAAIAYSKLNLATSIVNGDISGSAAIAYSKLAALTTTRALVSDGSGKIAVASTTAAEIEYVNGVTSAIQTQLDGKIAKTLTSTTGDMIYASGANTPARLAVGSSGQVLKSVGGIPTWATFSGGINYLSSNPDAEADTTGWATYADAAASSPVDGTGGSPSSTFTRSTSSPLRGTASFLWTKSAANRQGEGFSYDFSIDASDKAKVLQISFDYLVSSGTYADSDMTIWIYDVTNAALIQPAGYTIQNAGVSMAQKATFQAASNSTSYRLIVHTASTSASAYTLQFDNFAVGPQIVTNGAAVTDWVSFTPTGSLSTNVTYTGKRRRVGDQEEFRIKLDFSGANTQGALTVNLPVTIDTTKIPATVNGASVFGIGAVRDFGSADFDVITAYNSTTSVAVLLKNSSATYAYYAQVNTATNIPMTVAASDAIELSFSVPVVGYSSNVQLSSDTDTRVVAARVKLSANQTGVNPNNSAVKVNFNSVTVTSCFDTHGAYDTSAFRYNVAVPGKYEVAGLVALADTNILNNRYIVLIYKNGAEVLRGDEKTQAANTYLSLPFSGSIDAVSGDYIEVYLYGVGNNSASTLTITSVSHLNISRLSGPAVVAANETVAALYTGAPPTGTLTAGYNTTTFGTKVKDSHNAYSSGTYTIPVSGIYSISAASRHSATYGLGSLAAIAIYIDGTQKASNVAVAGGACGTLHPSVSINSYPLLAGQVVTIRCFNNGTTPSFTSAADENFFSITRTGNY